MARVFAYVLGTFLWLEVVYHIVVFGLNGVQPVLMIWLAVFIAALEVTFVKLSKKRGLNLGVLWGVQIINIFLFGAQLVYHKIFTRPLMIYTALITGGDAITDFGSIAVDGILHSLFPIALLLLPLPVMAVLLKKNVLTLEQHTHKDLIRSGCGIIVGLFLGITTLVSAYYFDEEFYAEFQEFYAPDEIAREYGVLALYGRQLMFDILPEKETDLLAWQESVGSTEDTETEMEKVVTGPIIDTSPNVLNIDFNLLYENGDDNIDRTADIMQAMTPSKKNEYTGMMEGYNLIYITAEAFSPYAVSEELTPTLYSMINSGVVVKDYYVPYWDTSTSDGEYMNLMGQLPDGLHSFRRTQYNTYPYALPKYFEAEGVKSYAYHNNSLSYYDRYITHPNLGYDFKAALSGKLSSGEWSSQLFQMEGARMWPSSDYEMMVGTVSEWIDDERFYAYYMSLSGHCNYDWDENQMSAKNRDLVAHLDCSEQMKGYIACNLELEKAVAYLVEQLTIAGKLDTTLIVISADHHPYGLKNVEAEMESFNGTEMTYLDVQRNCLIMWNSQMETIQVEKTCSSIDILPTIMNLMGFEYDSRLFAGRDILSDSPSMVVFSNRSFITDEVIYDAPSGNIISRTGAEISSEYMENMKAYVKTMFQYSANILNYGFDEAVYNAEIKNREHIE